MKPRMINREGVPVFGIEIVPSDLQGWWATVPQMRDCALRRYVVGPDFTPWCDKDKQAMVARFAPSQGEVELMGAMMHEAVSSGRVIDFGFWPNEAIKQGGRRGGPMWERGFIGMPFMDPWVLYHTWEGLPGIYLVNPKGDKPTSNDFEICELQPAIAQGNQMLTICDRALFQFPGMNVRQWDKYGGFVMPSTARFLPGAEMMNNGGDPSMAAGGNLGDPLMLALLILNTRNTDRETVRAPDKLQKARAKSNKPPIPPYDRINSAPYVTAITNRARQRSEGPGTGTHASPVPHVRMGHPRNYADGRSIFIRDTLVNVTDEARAEFMRRSHYEVRP